MYKRIKNEKEFEKKKQKKTEPIGKSNCRKKNVTCNLDCVIVTRINQPYLWL